MNAACLLATLLIGQADASAGRMPSYPTGVVTERLPRRAGFQASGPEARAFVRASLAYGEDGPPGPGGSPWLVLIGPDDATKQVASRLPEELRTRVQVARYEPDDPRLERGFREHYPGGTYAILLNPDRSIAWKGLCELREIVLRIRRLLGIDPEPEPWIRNPFRPGPGPGPETPGGSPMWLAVGLVAGLLGRSLASAALRAVAGAFRGQLRELVRDAMAEPSAAEPEAKATVGRKPAGK